VRAKRKVEVVSFERRESKEDSFHQESVQFALLAYLHISESIRVVRSWATPVPLNEHEPRA
jgi:hypothetical protein